jgi:hypothetical protein
MGGDVVFPGADGCTSACKPHSDWSAGKTHTSMICVSLLTDMIDSTCAPMVIWSDHDHRRRLMTGSKGTLIIRNVDTIHSGSPNTSEKARALPALRFVVAAGLRGGYKPTDFVPPHIFARFPPFLQDRAVFLLKESVPVSDEATSMSDAMSDTEDASTASTSSECVEQVVSVDIASS